MGVDKDVRVGGGFRWLPFAKEVADGASWNLYRKPVLDKFIQID